MDLRTSRVIFYPRDVEKRRVERKRHRVIFHGEKSRKSREDPSTSNKKRVENGRTDGWVGGEGTDGRENSFYPGPESLSFGALTTRATPVSRLSLDREKMSRPRQLGKIVSPPLVSPRSPPFPSCPEKGSSSLSESIGRHEQKPWEPYVREHVCV